MVDAYGYVTPLSFGAFLQRFGPFRGCIPRVQAVVKAKWFQWFITREEAERLLQGCSLGTFLIRLSVDKCQPRTSNRFALSYVERTSQGANQIQHVLVLNNRQGNITLEAVDGQLTYPTLVDLVTQQAAKLNAVPAPNAVSIIITCQPDTHISNTRSLQLPRDIDISNFVLMICAQFQIGMTSVYHVDFCILQPLTMTSQSKGL